MSRVLQKSCFFCLSHHVWFKTPRPLYRNSSVYVYLQSTEPLLCGDVSRLGNTTADSSCRASHQTVRARAPPFCWKGTKEPLIKRTKICFSHNPSGEKKACVSCHVSQRASCALWVWARELQRVLTHFNTFLQRSKRTSAASGCAWLCVMN